MRQVERSSPPRVTLKGPGEKPSPRVLYSVDDRREAHARRRRGHRYANQATTCPVRIAILPRAPRTLACEGKRERVDCRAAVRKAIVLGGPETDFVRRTGRS